MIEKRKEQLKGAKTAAQQQGQQQSQQMDTDEGDDNNQTLNAKFAPNLLNNCTDDLVKLLRLACTRNLARAFIIENTVAD